MGCGQDYSVGGSSSDVALCCHYCNNLFLAAVAIFCGTGCMLFMRLFHGVILLLLQCQTPSITHAHTFSTGICAIQMPFVIFLIIPFDFCILLFFCKSLSLFSFFIVGSKYFTCQYIFVNYYAFQYILLVNYYA